MGGLAVPNTGTINRDDIEGTLQYLYQLTDIPVDHLYLLGSAGKADVSNDLDIAVCAFHYDPTPIHEYLTSLLPEKCAVHNKGTGVYSYAIEICGDMTKGFVQVDLMFVENVRWARFAYFSDPTNSKYKGAVRTMLLMGVASTLNDPDVDYFKYDGDDLIIRAGRTLDLNKGLRRIFQYRPKKKRGKGYVKAMKSLTPEEFKAMFPEVKVDWVPTVHHPDSALLDMFGEGIKTKHVQTAEQVLEIIYDRFDEERQQKIFEKAATRVNKNNRYDLPPEIEAYVK